VDGIYDLQYSSYLENLKGNVPAADLAKMEGLQWEAPNFDVSKGAYVMPLETQFYIGFYNKALFKKAGITTVPPTGPSSWRTASCLRRRASSPWSTATAAKRLARSSTPGTT